MKGLSLRSLRLDLYKIEPDSREPLTTITDWKKKIGPWLSEISDRHRQPFDFVNDYHHLPLRMLAGFSFDELCKLHYSSAIMMNSTVIELFETRAQHEVVRKIENSMWRWSFSKGTWNEVVDAYDNIRHFTFVDNPDFEVRLDYSMYHNPYGYAKYSQTYIDGAFAFLVYYKRRHVMTIGFSIIDKRGVLIQQVQGAQRSGNRYLFKLPNNRIEFIVDLFRKNFPGYTLYLIDGHSLAEKILRDYRNGLQRTEESRRRCDSMFSPEYLQRMEGECAEFREKIAHLESDRPRLATFYRDAGNYQLGSDRFDALGLSHFPIVTQSVA